MPAQARAELLAHMEAVRGRVEALIAGCFGLLPRLAEIESMVGSVWEWVDCECVVGGHALVLAATSAGREWEHVAGRRGLPGQPRLAEVESIRGGWEAVVDPCYRQGGRKP